MRKCPKCSFDIHDESALFCENCGFSFGGGPLLAKKSSSIRSKRNMELSTKNKLKLSILGISLIVVIIGSTFLLLPPSSRSLSISSIDASESSVPPSNSFNNIPNVPSLVFTLTFHLVITFSGYNNIYSTGLGPCEFFATLNNPHWKLAELEYGCPASGSVVYSGTQKFTLTQVIVPTTNSYSNLSFPIHLSLAVSSKTFAVTSKAYNLTINSTGFNTLKLTHAQLNIDNNSITGETGYNISSEFYLVTDHDINLANACSPFSIQLMGATNWSVSSIHCLSLHPISFPPGRFKYNLTSQLVDSDGNLYNYSSSLPSSFTMEIILGSNVLKSNDYTVKI